MKHDPDLTQAIHDLVARAYPAYEPGVAVIVTRDGETLYEAAHGLANLELGVPAAPDTVFRIGSITKQFTAVAILMLSEAGQLDLQDPVTRFLPDYPTHGHTITLEHLLTHTSGIKSYTDLPEWAGMWRQDFSLDGLIALFKDQPMAFAPGERWSYNNSGYVLLGAVIERASGQTYAQFLRERVFAPLGMTRTHYDDPHPIIPGRAAGYEKEGDAFQNAAYLSMSQPYAAGSLASTVGDLARWDAALYTGRLLKTETLERAFAPYRLNDGSPTEYGYGWGVFDVQGQRLIEHGGGIHGFRSHAIRVPAARLYVAALSNNGGLVPDALAFQVAMLALGTPYPDPVPLALEAEALTRLEGVYEIAEGDERRIVRDGTRLFSERGGARSELIAVTANEFHFAGAILNRLVFLEEDGHVTGLEFRWRGTTHHRAARRPEREPA